MDQMEPWAVLKVIALALLDVSGLPLLALGLGWAGGAKYGTHDALTYALIALSILMIVTHRARKEL